MPDDDVANVGENRLQSLVDWTGQLLTAIAEARIPPSRMPLVPKQGSINLITSAIGVVLYTVATYVNAGGQAEGFAGQLTMIVIAAFLLFLAAIVVIASSGANILDDWKRTTSVFIVLWIFSLVVFIVLNWPLLLITHNFILLDRVVYGIVNLVAYPSAWVYDVIKSLVCAFIAGLILIYRTRLIDPNFSLRSIEPWSWLFLVTIIVGFVFYISVYLLGTIQGSS